MATSTTSNECRAQAEIEAKAVKIFQNKWKQAVEAGILTGVVVYTADGVIEILGVKFVATKIFSLLADVFVICGKTIGLGALHGCGGVLIAGIIDIIRCCIKYKFGTPKKYSKDKTLNKKLFKKDVWAVARSTFAGSAVAAVIGIIVALVVPHVGWLIGGMIVATGIGLLVKWFVERWLRGKNIKGKKYEFYKWAKEMNEKTKSKFKFKPEKDELEQKMDKDYGEYEINQQLMFVSLYDFFEAVKDWKLQGAIAEGTLKLETIQRMYDHKLWALEQEFANNEQAGIRLDRSLEMLTICQAKCTLDAYVKYIQDYKLPLVGDNSNNDNSNNNNNNNNDYTEKNDQRMQKIKTEIFRKFEKYDETFRKQTLFTYDKKKKKFKYNINTAQSKKLSVDDDFAPEMSILSLDQQVMLDNSDKSIRETLALASTYQEWSQDDVCYWVSTTLTKNNINANDGQSFVKEWKKQCITGKVLSYFKRDNKQLDELKNKFSQENQAFGIWLALKEEINSL